MRHSLRKCTDCMNCTSASFRSLKCWLPCGKFCTKLAGFDFGFGFWLAIGCGLTLNGFEIAIELIGALWALEVKKQWQYWTVAYSRLVAWGCKSLVSFFFNKFKHSQIASVITTTTAIIIIRNTNSSLISAIVVDILRLISLLFIAFAYFYQTLHALDIGN